MLAQWYFNMPGGEQGVGMMRFDTTNPDEPLNDLSDFDTDDAMTDVWGDLRTFWTGATSRVPKHVTLQGMKWNQIDRDGRYVADVTRYVDLGANPLPGGLDTPVVYPNQIALVTSYETGVTRGLAHEGRTYWPTGAPLAADGRISIGDAGQVAGAVSQLLADWANWPGIDFNGYGPCVMSPLRGGASRYISRVRVGRVLDTQRRRRRSQVESYVQGDPIPNPG